MNYIVTIIICMFTMCATLNAQSVTAYGRTYKDVEFVGMKKGVVYVKYKLGIMALEFISLDRKTRNIFLMSDITTKDGKVHECAIIYMMSPESLLVYCPFAKTFDEKHAVIKKDDLSDTWKRKLGYNG